MNSKETILSQIRKNLPGGSVEDIKIDFISESNPQVRFLESLKAVGGKPVYKEDIKDWNSWKKNNFGMDINFYSELDEYPGNLILEADISKKQLNDIDVAVLQGELGVAENGAIWVEKFAHRSIPFITQHLILVMNRSNIIANMHEAYAKLSKEKIADFGTFISGPSKTADIEQSLVYGAHGPRTLTVIIS